MLGIPFLSRFVEKTVKRQTVADTVDHLNHYVTSYLLGFFAIAISAKQYFGSPIQCWVPSEFRGGWEKYAEDYCFIANSYHVPFENEIPEQGDGRQDHISYYRWVPIVLALQSVCFFLPNYFWNVIHKQTAINPRAFLKEAEKITALSGEKREEELSKLANYFMDTVSVFGDASYRSKLRATPRSGKNAMLLYLATKLLYVMNIWGQVIILNHFLGEDYLHWGYQAAWNIALGNQWKESTVFPRVIMCDFQIRRLGNIQNHTVQCVIMMNMINEKLYLFLYFWFLFLAAVTVINFLYYAIVLLIPHFRTSLIMVKVNEGKKGSMDQRHRRDMQRFVSECLHPDGVLLLQFLTEHVGGRITFDLANKILALYSAQESFSDDSIEKHPHSPMIPHKQFPLPPTYQQSKNFYPDMVDSSAPLQDYMEQGTLRVGEKAPGAPSSSRSSPTDV